MAPAVEERTESMNPKWFDLFDESSGEILDGPTDIARRKD
jgi:hypothetical protein